jgi:hypothetical protein
MNFREKLARFLYGRYGADSLYNALFIFELILLFIGAVLSVLGNVEPILSVLSVFFYLAALGLLIWSILRFFSRNIAKRRKENEAWLRLKAKLTPKKKPKLPPDTPTHIFRACPKCRSTLRLPRQAGKHQVKCPRCGERFGVKVK